MPETQGAIFTLAFYLLSVLTLVSAAMATFARSVVTSAFALFFTLVGLSGYFILLGSDFLAIVQVVVYVGGILTLLLFGILLTNRSYKGVSGEQETASRLPGLVLAGLLMVLLVGSLAIGDLGRTVPPKAPLQAAYAPKTSEMGAQLLSRHLLTFELAGLTLLGALLGAAYLVRRKDA